MTRGVGFWNRIANRYARQPVADPAAYEKKLDLTRKCFPTAAKVLEFGCGTGSTAIAHAPFVASLRAVDVAPRMIEIATAKARAAGVNNVHFELGELHDADPGPYDTILGMSILHLLENRRETIQLVYDNLEAGGVFVSSTACLRDTHAWLRFIVPVGGWLRLMPPVAFFRRDDLKRELCDAGFVIETEWHPDPKAALFLIARKPG